MNWRAIVQYMGLVGINCAQAYAINRATRGAEWGSIITLATMSLTWAAYLELAVGGIIYRPDSNNNRIFKFEWVIQQLDWPLTDRAAWRPDFWDLNYYTVIAGSALTYTAWQHF